MLVINTVWRHLARRPVFLPLLGVYSQGFPGGLEGKASSRNARDPCSIPWWGRSPGEGHGNPTPVFLPGESHGRRSLVGYSPQGRKESDTTERLRLYTIIVYTIHYFGQSIDLFI